MANETTRTKGARKGSGELATELCQKLMAAQSKAYQEGDQSMVAAFEEARKLIEAVQKGATDFDVPA